MIVKKNNDTNYFGNLNMLMEGLTVSWVPSGWSNGSYTNLIHILFIPIKELK